nr:hypothetical protein [Sphingomonas melonis]
MVSGSWRAIVSVGLVLSLVCGAEARDIPVPGSKPTTIVPDTLPFAFAGDPTIRQRVGRDEPFVEGDIAYGYQGHLVTPLLRGKDVVAPAGAPAYGVPMMTPSGQLHLVWCAVTRKPDKPRRDAVCMFDPGLGSSANDSLMMTSAFVFDHDLHGGGEIAPGDFDLGGTAHVRYFIHNLGKIARVKARITIGDVVVNQWGYVFGDILRGSQPGERLFSVGGGTIGVMPDPAAKDRYVVRIVTSPKAGGAVPLAEVRNDAHATGH